MIRRRSLLAAPLLAGAAGLLPPRRADAASGRVVVGTWGGDYANLLQANVGDPLMKPQGIEVVQDVAPQDPRKTKLIAERVSRHGTMDVACLSDVDMYQMAQLNILQDPTEQSVPNLKNVIPALRHAYAAPHIYSGMVILYNPAKVSPAPTSYAELWDPKYKDRVGFSDLLYQWIIEAASVVGGGGPSDFAPGKAKLMELKKLGAKVYPSNETLAVALQGGEVWLTMMWLARGYFWKKSGIEIAHAVPKEGATPILFEAGVPRNAPDPDNGFAYLNALLDPQAQVAFADKMGYVPTVTDAKLPEALEREIGFTPEQQSNFQKLDYAYMAKNAADSLDFWNKQFKA